LSVQLRTAYMMGSQNTIKFLLNQHDTSQLSRMWHYYQYLNDARNQAINEINQTLTDIANNEADINTHQAQLQQLKKEQQTNRQALNQQQQQRKQAIQHLHTSIKNNEQRLQQLRTNQRALVNVIRGIKRQPVIMPAKTISFKRLKGKLNWPVKRGEVIERFNTRIDNSQTRLKATIIAAPRGSNVYAIATGKVVFANWLRGLGLLIIVDNGHGYMTLYGYNQSLYKQVGDTVRAGDIIATVGDSGGQHTDALYFAIRHNGKPVNPLAWVNTQNLSTYKTV